jgi:hypothetical protein
MEDTGATLEPEDQPGEHQNNVKLLLEHVRHVTPLRGLRLHEACRGLGLGRRTIRSPAQREVGENEVLGDS